MGYVLPCWIVDETVEPEDRFEALQEAPETAPEPAVVAFIRDLTERWPDGEDMDEDVSPWADAPLMPNASGEMVLLNVVLSRLADAVPIIVTTAEAHGMEVFDPVSGLLVSAD